MSDTEKEIELIKEKLELMERLLEVEKELAEINPPRIVYPDPCPRPIIVPIVPDPCPPQPCPQRPWYEIKPIWKWDPDTAPIYVEPEPYTTCDSFTVTTTTDKPYLII